MARDARQLELELVKFNVEDKELELSLDPSKDTIWANAMQMASLFGTKPEVIHRLVRDVFMQGELDEASSLRMLEYEGDHGSVARIPHYNLDVILSVGYRVSSRKATEFRQWATRTLRLYLEKGYVLDEKRLLSDSTSLGELAAEVRRLRTQEKNIYQAVRDAVMASAVNYDPNSKVTRSFYAKLQDKFLVASTGKTACEIVMSRADHTKSSMGLTATKSGRPTAADVKTGKNYLHPKELYALHILAEQFLLFLESKAMSEKPLTMDEIAAKFDQLLEVQGHDVLRGYEGKPYLRKQAEEHARRELEAYRQMIRLSGKSSGSLPPNG